MKSKMKTKQKTGKANLNQCSALVEGCCSTENTWDSPNFHGCACCSTDLGPRPMKTMGLFWFILGSVLWHLPVVVDDTVWLGKRLGSNLD